MQLRPRFLAAVTMVAALAGVLASIALGAKVGAPVVVTEKAGDASTGAPDLVRVEMSKTADGHLRAAMTFADAVTNKSLVSKTGPPGSLCMRIYTNSTPGVLPPDFLVCATPDAKGKALHGSVLAEQVNALPKRVAGAVVTRASSKSAVLRFSQSSVGRPSIIHFAAEATRASCTRTSCVDTLPDKPDTAKLLVRAEAPDAG